MKYAFFNPFAYQIPVKSVYSTCSGPGVSIPHPKLTPSPIAHQIENAAEIALAKLL